MAKVKLRRSLATGLASFEVGLPVIERILCHRGGVFRGAAGIYQRFDFYPQMTAALERWAQHVLGLAAGLSDPGRPSSCLMREVAS